MGYAGGGMFKRVKGYHAGNAMNQPPPAMGYAGGGIVNVPGFAGERAAASVVPMILTIAKRFGLTLTDAFGQGHKSPGHTRTGTAADFSGPDRNMDRAVKWLVQKGYLVGYDGRFGSQDWPGHGPSTRTPNFHLHVELGSKASGGGAVPGMEALRNLPKLSTNVGGYLGAMLQGGIDVTRAAANARIKSLNDSNTVEPVAGGGSGTATTTQARRWIAAGLRLAGQPVNKNSIDILLGRAQQESGLNPRAINLWDSNAKKGTPSKGFLQTIDSTFNAYKVKGHNDIWNPVDNTAAAIRYMLARYGHLVAASSTGYAMGGYTVPGGAGQGVPALLHGTEWVLDSPQQHRLSKIVGASTGYLKGMLGLNKTKGVASFSGGGAADRIAASSSSLFKGTQIGKWAEFLREVEKLTKMVSNSGTAGRAIKRLATLFDEGGTFAKMGEVVEQARVMAARRLTRANFSASGGRFSRTMSSQDRAQGELANLVGERGLLNAQKDTLTGASNAIARQLSDAQKERGKKGLSKKRKEQLDKQIAQLQGRQNEATQALDGISQQIADNIQAIVEQQEAVQAAAAEAVNNDASKATATIDVQQRIRNAFGDKSGDVGFIDQRIKIMSEQSAKLSAVMAQAASTGNTELAESIRSQMESLTGDIYEAIASKTAAAHDAIDADANRKLSMNDLNASFAQIGRTNFGALGASLAERGNILRQVQGAKSALLGEAYATGNVGQAQALEDELAQLRLQIAQNSQAIEDNTDAANADRIDRISSRVSFGTGVYGGLQSLVQSIANFTGANTDSMQAGFLRRNSNALSTARGGYASELLSQFGIDVRGLTGAALANMLGGLDYTNITTNMSDPDRQRFEGLINSLISNEQAILTNTQALDELNGVNKEQSFSSTAWQMYRMPIFNGLGQMVPSMRVAGAASGAMVMSSGLLQVHSGEEVRAANIVRAKPSGGDQHLSLTVNEAGRIPDPTTFASQFAWLLKNKR